MTWLAPHETTECLRSERSDCQPANSIIIAKLYAKPFFSRDESVDYWGRSGSGVVIPPLSINSPRWIFFADAYRVDLNVWDVDPF